MGNWLVMGDLDGGLGGERGNLNADWIMVVGSQHKEPLQQIFLKSQCNYSKYAPEELEHAIPLDGK